MPKYMFKKRLRFVMEDAKQMIIPSSSGIPQVVNTPPKILEIPINLELDPTEFVKTNPQFTVDEIVKRIERSRKYGTSDIVHMTEADERAIEIKSKALRQAEVDIKKMREGVAPIAKEKILAP